MKALCITGTKNAVLKDIAAPFYRAGMHPPASLQREQKIDFSRWHQMAGTTLKARKPLGKIWENLASDLILANLESDCWGWYEENSVAALDFWAELEPNIHFLLVCTRPEQELEEKIATADSSLNAEQWLSEWYQRHQKMLNFYLKYPDRCLLIDDTAALQHINGQLQLAHQQWQLPLNTSQLSQETAEQQTELPSSLVVCAESSQQGEIASWIVRELIKNSPNDITAFYTELQAALYPFTGQQAGGKAKGLVDWLNLKLDEPQLQGLLQDYQRLHRLANNNEQLLTLQTEKNTTQQTLEKTKQENDLLLLQLHQVQEEQGNLIKRNKKLEQKVTQFRQQQQELQTKLFATEANEQKHKANALNLKKQLEQAGLNSTVQQELEAIKKENELLLLQLHQVQEELENYFLQHQKTIKEKEQLAVENRRLKQQLNQAEQLIVEQPVGLLNKLRKKQQKQPQLKYNKAQLQHEQINPDYEHLWIKLKSPSFGSQVADEWSFRLSCAGVRPNDFGSQPKLELPEQPEQLLQQWFTESENEYGRKLELRFALPNAMDSGVWKKLHTKDQQLIRSLVGELPSILEKLKQQSCHITRSWDDWQKLATDMRHILLSKVKS